MDTLLATSPEVYVSKVRRELNGFARGESKYRGVTRRSKAGIVTPRPQKPRSTTSPDSRATTAGRFPWRSFEATFCVVAAAYLCVA